VQAKEIKHCIIIYFRIHQSLSVVAEGYGAGGAVAVFSHNRIMFIFVDYIIDNGTDEIVKSTFQQNTPVLCIISYYIYF